MKNFQQQCETLPLIQGYQNQITAVQPKELESKKFSAILQRSMQYLPSILNQLDEVAAKKKCLETVFRLKSLYPSYGKQLSFASQEELSFVYLEYTNMITDFWCPKAYKMLFESLAIEYPDTMPTFFQIRNLYHKCIKYIHKDMIEMLSNIDEQIADLENELTIDHRYDWQAKPKQELQDAIKLLKEQRVQVLNKRGE